MEKILDIGLGFAKKPAKYGMIGALLAAALFSLLVNAGNFGGSFMPVIATLFVLLIEIALWACLPVLVLVKKEELAKAFFLPILFYWYMSMLYTFFAGMTWARPNVGGVFVACGVFEFFLALAFLAAVALYVVGKVKKNALFEKLAFAVFACSFVFFLVTFALRMAAEAAWNSPWNDYFDVIRTFLFLPVGMFFAALYFYPPKAAEAVVSESTEETVPAETPVSAEETAEEPVILDETQPEEETNDAWEVAATEEAQQEPVEETQTQEPTKNESAEETIAEEPTEEEIVEEPAEEQPEETVGVAEELRVD